MVRNRSFGEVTTINIIFPIQYLRGLAALMVVAFHAPMPFPGARLVLDGGAYGVDLFFVISGFIMARAADLTSSTRADFIIKRVVRVVPLYWAMTLIMVSLVLIAPNLFRTTKVDLSTVVQSLLFVPHFSISHPGVIYPVMVPGWTLNFEMFFYLMFALFVPFNPKVRILGITLLFVLLIGLGLVFPGESAIYRTYTNPLLVEFLFGVGVAILYKYNFLPGRKTAYGFIVAGYSALILTDESVRCLTKGLPATTVLLGGLVALQSVESKALKLIGDASYSIYLTHFFSFGLVTAVGNRLVNHTGSILYSVYYFITAVVVSVCAGIAVYKVVEIPITSYARPHINRLRGRSVHKRLEDLVGVPDRKY